MSLYEDEAETPSRQQHLERSVTHLLSKQSELDQISSPLGYHIATPAYDNNPFLTPTSDWGIDDDYNLSENSDDDYTFPTPSSSFGSASRSLSPIASTSAKKQSRQSRNSSTKTSKKHLRSNDNSQEANTMKVEKNTEKKNKKRKKKMRDVYSMTDDNSEDDYLPTRPLKSTMLCKLYPSINYINKRFYI